MIKPETLKKKDKVAIVAPSMSAKAESINKAIKQVRQLGLNPIVYKSCYMINDKEQVPAQERANDIMEAFKDESIKGIIALRAGYGTLEILDLLDYNIIRQNPKVFMGFSDITGMHLALNKFCDLVTFHGPIATSNIRVKTANGTEIDPYTKKYIEKALFEERAIGILENPENEEITILKEGIAQGKLIGGNLSLLHQTLGTKYEIDCKNKIIFIEDFGESIDNIDKMIVDLKNAGKFNDCVGILIGTWIKCAEELPEQERDKMINNRIVSILGDLNKPIMCNIRSGHSIPMMTFPEGVETIIDTREKNIEIIEEATICRKREAEIYR